MIVVADTGPVHYLVLIEAIDVLQPLYDRVLVPQAVAGELQADGTPAAVKSWIADPPIWVEIRPDPPEEPGMALLDPGERAAIMLALSYRAKRLLIDERYGRAEAERRQLMVTHTWCPGGGTSSRLAGFRELPYAASSDQFLSLCPTCGTRTPAAVCDEGIAPQNIQISLIADLPCALCHRSGRACDCWLIPSDSFAACVAHARSRLRSANPPAPDSVSL